MGSYREAIDNFLAGITTKPDITAHPPQTLQAPCLAGNLSFVQPAAHQQSRIQSGPRTGGRAYAATACGVLDGGVAKFLGRRTKVC